MALIPDLPNIPINIEWFGIVGSVITYLTYALIGVGAILFGVLIAIALQHDMKVMYWPLYGSSKDGVFSVGKQKRNRARWVKGRTAWRMLWPLFNKVNIKPFDSEFIYPGKQVYAYKLNQEYCPARHNARITVKNLLERMPIYVKQSVPSDNPGFDYVQVTDIENSLFLYYPIKIGGNLSEDYLRGSLDAIPPELKSWGISQMQQNKIEFRKDDWWTTNKQMITGMIVVGLCLSLGAFTIWLSYKTTFDVKQGLQEVGGLLQNVADSFRASQAAPPG